MRCTLHWKAGIRCLRHSRTIVVLVLGLGLSVAQSQEPASAPPRLKVTSNLVVVRVVVSDANGHSVPGLHEGDFKIFDRGKEQSIVHFEVELAGRDDKSPAGVPSPEPGSIPLSSEKSGEVAGQHASSDLPKNFLALYFDNLSTTDTDLVAARNAAERYLSSSLKPNERVAIFSSEQLLADFTDDPRELVKALGNLHVSVRARASASDCPHLSDYQALQITQFAEQPNADAWILARDEMAQCNMLSSLSAKATENSGGSAGNSGGQGGPGGISNAGFDRDPEIAGILSRARGVVLQNQNLVRSNLQQLDRVVQRLSQMPGQRNVLLASPGFLTQEGPIQFQLDRIVDRALNGQVVISSIDPKGLAGQMRGTDATRGYIPTHGDALRASHALDSNRENVVTSVLAEVAEGTGGKYVHNTNDLKAGFAALERPGAYILAFAPAELKADGGFHALKVTVGGEGKNFTIQARRGYFAPNGEAPVEAPAMGGGDPGARAQHDRIQQQLLSKEDVSQLPVWLSTSVTQQAETRVLSVTPRLDTKALQFLREGDHNQNTITFVVAVFDGKDKLIEGQQRRLSINALDAQLPAIFTRGLETTFAFKLGFGTYRVRAVVADSVQHLMGAKSDSVAIP
jgi:VWFA-related protein